MSTVAASDVKRLRDETGAGMMDCKRALAESGGDIEAAKDLLRVWGVAGVAKRASRSATEGTVATYLHQIDPELPPRLGVLVEINCETDFVAKTPDFRELGRNIALHIAAMEPRWITRDEVPAEIVERERSVIMASTQASGKPPEIVEKIVEGKLRSLFSDRGGVLLDQPFVKDESGKKTVGDLVGDVAAAMKENVVIRRFSRFRVGEADQG